MESTNNGDLRLIPLFVVSFDIFNFLTLSSLMAWIFWQKLLCCSRYIWTAVYLNYLLLVRSARSHLLGCFDLIRVGRLFSWLEPFGIELINWPVMNPFNIGWVSHRTRGGRSCFQSKCAVRTRSCMMLLLVTTNVNLRLWHTVYSIASEITLLWVRHLSL